MKIYVTSVFVDDQAKALEFYTKMLGFEVKNDIPVGEHRWLTVTAKGDSDGTELLLEPSEHPAVRPYQSALMMDGIPATSFQVNDLEEEYARLTGLGVEFTQDPMTAGDVKMAILNDTCGNLIQLVEMINQD